jgi:predicted dehydrogenase
VVVDPNARDTDKKEQATWRYAIVGTGGRGLFFLRGAADAYRDHSHVVGLCDTNAGRMAFYNRMLEKEFGHAPAPTYSPDEFDRMIREQNPDVVVVTTPDCHHDRYIISALEQGCDVITEKPMTIDAPRCRAILDAVDRTGRRLTVSFNYRWAVGPTRVREVLQEGIIGDIIHVDMEYMLDRFHGADYFRRWHRDKSKSGGLMVHKATHHFDLVNWWLDAVPQAVFGLGKLSFYGPQNGKQMGFDVDYPRSHGHKSADDPFAFDWDHHPILRPLYLDVEEYDHYVRDQNVFGEGISIEDTMSALVKYRTGTVLNYSLNAYLPREGYTVAFNGTRGRLEYVEMHPSHIIAGQDDEELGEQTKGSKTLTLYKYPNKVESLDIPAAIGGHGGGDAPLQRELFAPAPPVDPFNRRAGHEQAAASILIGIAANQSFNSGEMVQIKDLCPALGDATRLSDLV